MSSDVCKIAEEHFLLEIRPYHKLRSRCKIICPECGIAAFTYEPGEWLFLERCVNCGADLSRYKYYPEDLVFIPVPLIESKLHRRCVDVRGILHP